MKRFLLTLLGVAALCGLSPHHAAAQSVEKLSMDLGLRTADHNTDLTYTKSKTTSPWFDTNIKTAAAASGGFQKIENDQFIIEFNYFDPLAGASATDEKKSHFTTQWNTASKPAPGIAVFQGSRFSIKLKDTSKRIISLKIKTGVTSNHFPEASVTANVNPVKSLTDGGKDASVTVSSNVYDYVSGSSTKQCREISLGSGTPSGFADGIIIELPKSGCRRVMNTTSSLVSSFSAYYPAIVISEIEAEVVNVADIPKTGKIYGYASATQVWSDGKWITPTQSTYDDQTVKFRLGKVITEFTRTENTPAGKPTVTYSAASKTLGAHIGVEVRSYPDESVIYNGKPSATYSAEYRLNNPFKTTPTSNVSSAYVSSRNLYGGTNLAVSTVANWKNFVKKYDDGTVFSLTYVSHMAAATADKPAIAKSKSIVKLSRTAGISDTTTIIVPTSSTIQIQYMDPMTNTGAGAANVAYPTVKDGTLPAFVFDEVDLTVATDEPTGSRAPSLEVSAATDDLANLQGDGSYLFKKSINIKATLDDEDFPDAKFYYMTGDAPAASFDKSKATAVGDDGTITANATGYVSVFAVVTVGDKEVASAPATVALERFQSTVISTYADLLKPENNGKVITLDITTRTRYDGYIQGRKATIDAPYMPFAFIYDNDGNPIKVSATQLGTTAAEQAQFKDLLTGPGTPISKAKTLFVSPSATLDDDKFIEAKSIVGRLSLVDGHPEIILVNEVGDDKFDWRDFCATTTKTSAEIGMTADQKTKADEAFKREYKSTELLPEHWGRYVTIEWLGGYEATDSTCVDSKNNKIHMMFGGGYPAPYGITSNTTQQTSRVTSLTKGSATTRHALTGLVDNRHNSTELMITVQNLYYHLGKPAVIAKCGTETLTPRETVEADADQTFDYTYPTSLSISGLTLALDRDKGQPSAAQISTITLTYFDMNDNGKKCTPSVAKAVNGRYLIKVVASIAKNGTSDPLLQPAMKDSCIVSAYNTVLERISYFFGDNAGLTAEDIERNPYVCMDMIPNINNKYPTAPVIFPTMMIYDSFADGTIFLARDVRRDMDSENKDIIPDSGYPRWYIIKSDTKRNPSYYTVDNSNWITHYKLSTGMRAGDAIQRLITKAILNEKGNIVYDNTDSQFASYCQIIDVNDNKKPAFVNQYDELATVVEFDNIATATIGKEQLGMIVSLPDAVITKDADGEYRVNTATANALAWDILRAADKDTHAGMVDQAQEGDRFAVKALVLNDGKGGYALEVIDFKAGYARSLHVCRHPGHDSYYADQNFDGVDAGKQVEMLGVELTKDADGKVTTELSSTVSLVWTSFPDLEAGHKALIVESDGQKTLTFNVAGTLVRGDDGSVSIDVNEMTAVPSYPYFSDYNNKFVFNDAPYNHYNDPQYNNFLDYFKVDVRGPGYLTAYYRFATTEEGLADAPEMKFDESRTAKFAEAGYIDVYTCNPGKRGLFHDKVRKFNKIATVAPSLSDILDAEESNEIARYHLTGSLLITGTAQYEYHETDAPDITKIGYIAMATDADGRHVRILFQDAYKFIPKVGQHIADFGLAQTTASFFDAERTHRKYNLLATSNIKPFKPFEPEAGQEIAMPRSIARTAIDAADKSRRVRLIDMKIGGNATDGYTLTPADGTEPIRLNNVLYWTPADGFDPDAEYAVEGYVMPAKPAEATASLTAKAGTEEMEFWPLYEEKKRQTDTPELLVSGYESADGDSYVAVEPVTLTATVEGRDADAPIEYSTDGGATWITMTDGKLTIDRSAKVDVRAHFPGFSPSETVSVEIKREYYSAEAVITPDQRGGYTTVTFAPGENAADGTDFTVYYTLDGSEPDMNAAKFTPGMKPLELTEATTVKALMIEQGKRPAKTIASQALTVRANDLDITADKGEGFTTVAIAPKNAKHVDPKAEIRYTTDGTEPTASSQLYKGEFEVEAADNGMTIKAICIEPGKTAGNVASATVAVEGLRPSCDVTISYTEADGVYTITLTAPAGKIFYALNDATEFKLYDPAKPITYVSDTDGTCRIRAYALEEGKKEGKIAEHSFAVTGISGVEADQEAGSVRVEGNSIIVPEGAQTFDIAGRRVNPQGLPRGIYIVRLASGKAVKAVVK